MNSMRKTYDKILINRKKYQNSMEEGCVKYVEKKLNKSMK